MVENLQRIAGTKSHGQRLLAALNQKGGKPGVSGAAAYRGPISAQRGIPFPALEPPGPVDRSMPSRRDNPPPNWGTPAAGGGGTRDPYHFDSPVADDEEEPEAIRRNRPASTSGKGNGITLGKRNGAPVLGGSDPKRQANIGSLFQQANKRQQAARLVPAGMVNLGNTCYLNSVIQVLLNMQSFTKDLQHPALDRIKGHLPPWGVCMALEATLNKLRTATSARPTLDGYKPAVEPSELRAAMGRRSGRWRSYAQQDSHEFLVELLEGLQSEVLAAEGVASGRKKVLLSSTRCPAARNLSGCVMHTWTCSRCGHCTRAKELFSCLSLQLPPHGSVKLQDLVAEYLKDETIEKNCDSCSPSAPVPHTAQHHFWRLPRVLVVHIKRFMALPQLPQLAGPLPQPQGQGSQGAAEPAAGPAAAAAVLGTDDNGDAAPVAPGSAPGTPTRGAPDGRPSSAPGREGSADAGPSNTAGPQSAPAAPTNRDTSPPAQYTYAKVHTVVEVRPWLELAPHCDSAATAHKHLLEGVPPSALSKSPADDGTAADAENADGTGAAVAGGHATQTPQMLGAGKTPARGTPAAPTLDTAGGASTCPSPSFFQANESALQERTVQHQGTHGVTHAPHTRSRLGLTKTPGGKGAGGAQPVDSECGTSAMSTGAQAGGDGEAPTPHGGIMPSFARCLRDLYRSSLDESLAAKDHDPGRNADYPGGSTGGGVRGIVPAGGTAAVTPHVPLRPGVGGCGGGTGDPTPGGKPAAHRLGNDEESPALAHLPNNTVRRSTGALAAGATDGAAACSGRKAPKAMGAGNFFGSAGGSGQHQQQVEDNAPHRPVKRMCMDPPSSSTGKLAAEMRNSTQELRRGIQNSLQPFPPGVTPRRIEDLTEDEQFELVLKMSLYEEQSRAFAESLLTDCTAASDRPCAGGAADPMLELSVPTAAAAGRHGSNDDAVAGCSGGEASKGQSAGRRVPPGGLAEGADREVAVGSDLDAGLAELQDESPGGAGAPRRRGGSPRCTDARPALSDPALSGASGDRGADGDEDEASGDNGTSSLPRAAALGHRPRRADRKGRHRRQPGLREPLIVDSAESPATAPPPGKKHPSEGARPRGRHGAGSGSGAVEDVNNIYHKDGGLCPADDEEDGTTALSPVSGSAQPPGGRSTILTGGVGSQGPAEVPPPSAPSAPEDPYALPVEDEADPDMAAALRLSLQTFEQEEAERKRQSGCFTSPGGADLGGGSGSAAGRHGESVPDAVAQGGVGGSAKQQQPWTWTTLSPGKPWKLHGTRTSGMGPAAGRRADSRKADEQWQRVLSQPDFDDNNCAAPVVGGRGAGNGAAGVACHISNSDDDDVVVQTTPQGRAQPNGPGASAAAGEAGGRGSGIDALVAAAGLGAASVGPATAAASGPAPPTGQRPQVPPGNSQFKFQFPLPDFVQAAVDAGADANGWDAFVGLAPDAGAGASGAGVPGTRRDNPVDLTGDGGCGEEDDPELNQAILLSLQEKNNQTLVHDAGDDPMDVEFPDEAGNDGNGLPPREKVILQEDSDGETEEKDGEAAETDQAPASQLDPKPARPSEPTAASRQAQPCAPSGSGADGSGGRGGVPLAQVAQYRLQGVVRHKGLTPFSGHYVADVLIPMPSGQAWFEHNDAVVSHVDFARVREDAEKQGYMFFFVNEATRAALTAGGTAGAAAAGGAVTAAPPMAAAVKAAAATPLPDDDEVSAQAA